MAKEYVYTRPMRSGGWFDSDRECSEFFIKASTDHFNGLLHDGFIVFLNEVLLAYGYPRIPAGQCVGWIHGEEVVIECDWENETITFRCEEILSRWIKEVEKK